MNNLHMPSNLRLFRFLLAAIIFMIVKAQVLNEIEIAPDMAMTREAWELWVQDGMP